jgi:hypothetical protein
VKVSKDGEGEALGGLITGEAERNLVGLEFIVAQKMNPNKLERDKLEKGDYGQHDGSRYRRRPYRPPVPEVLPKFTTDKVGSRLQVGRVCTVPSARTDLPTEERRRKCFFTNDQKRKRKRKVL